MSWLKIVLAGVELLSGLVTLLKQRQLLSAGEATAIAEALRETHERVEKARAARRRAADGMSGDDPYLRD